MQNMQKERVSDYALRGINPYRKNAVREFAGYSVLDVGCGSGAYVLALSEEFDIKGVDHQEFPTWAGRPDRFSISDAHALSLPSESVDTILSFETLEHLEEPTRALREYFRVCRRNIIITVPNCEITEGMRASGIIFNHWIDRTHVNFWTMDELCKLIKSVGFEIQVKRKINNIQIGPALMEAFGIGGLLAKFGAHLIRLLSRRKQPMTLLVVAAKPNLK